MGTSIEALNGLMLRDSTVEPHSSKQWHSSTWANPPYIYILKLQLNFLVLFLWCVFLIIVVVSLFFCDLLSTNELHYETCKLWNMLDKVSKNFQPKIVTSCYNIFRFFSVFSTKIHINMHDIVIYIGVFMYNESIS